MARDLSPHWRRLIAGSLAGLAAAFIVPRFVHAPDLDENRTLAARPAWPQGPADFAAFRKGVDAYVADDFPARPHLIGALNFLRLTFGVSGSSRVLVGRHGWLFYDNGSHLAAASGAWRLDETPTRSWLQGLAGRTEALKRQGAAYLVVVPPDKEDAYPQEAPAWFHLDPDRNAVRLTRLAAAAQAGDVLYLGPALKQPAHWGVKLYDRYETHWTGLGAYYGYAALIRRLQAMGVVAEGPRPLEAFTEVHEGDPDTPRNLALMLGVASFVRPDYPQLDDPAAEARLKTTYLTKDIDWTKPRVIDTGQTGKPVLLMTMDSFSNALLPFLYGHFSRIILAHNQDGPWREDLIQRLKPDIVVLEVVESGLPLVMDGAPPPSPEAQARIEKAMAHSPPAPPRGKASAPTAWWRRLLTRLEPGGGRARPVEGGDGDDRLDGTPGDDTIMGRGGNDTIHGLGGNDVLRGGKGNDVIDGGDGNDWISGDRGNDTLTGGRGADLFHSSEDADLDVVTDFSVAEGDRVVLDRRTRYTVRQVGPDTVIEMRGTRLILKGVRAADLPGNAILYQ